MKFVHLHIHDHIVWHSIIAVVGIYTHQLVTFEIACFTLLTEIENAYRCNFAGKPLLTNHAMSTIFVTSRWSRFYTDNSRKIDKN